jgi:RNA polymerase sigma factor (TIGR02999 family)
MSPSSEDLTGILQALVRGEAGAFDRLVPLIYEDLRRIARGQLRRLRPGQTLDTTGLVHEAYIKLVDQRAATFVDRSHFFAIAARAMRQILVDYAKRKARHKRGGGKPDLELDEGKVAVAAQAESLLAVDEALEKLASYDARLVEVVECCLFAGYSEKETAETLSMSLRTVQRDWLRARGWLRTFWDAAQE